MAGLKKQIKRRLPLVFIFLILLAGIGLFMYPIVSNWYGEYTAHTSIQSYDKTIQEVGDEAISKMQKAADEYNEALSRHDSKKISSINYNDLLAVTDSIGYIEIPKINVYLPIFHGMDDDALQKGVGHMEGTSLPIGGSSTHCVLAGHTGLPSSKLFTDIDTLQNGDDFYIHVLDKVLKYRVDQIKTVLPYESDDIRIVQDKDYVTLVTCTPYGINSHRLLVRGERVQMTAMQEKEKKVNASAWPTYYQEKVQLPLRTVIWYAATIIMIIIVVGILAIMLFPSLTKRRKKKKAADNNSQSENTVQTTDSKSEDLEE